MYQKQAEERDWKKRMNQNKDDTGTRQTTEEMEVDGGATAIVTRIIKNGNKDRNTRNYEKRRKNKKTELARSSFAPVTNPNSSLG